jgi:hypothetical protein
VGLDWFTGFLASETCPGRSAGRMLPAEKRVRTLHPII